jgi:hypothetical protein
LGKLPSGRVFLINPYYVENSGVEKVEYSPSSKKLSFNVKIRNLNGKEVKKDFQFYPLEVSWKTGSLSYGMLKQTDCVNCSDILLALVRASNEFVRQEKQENSTQK